MLATARRPLRPAPGFCQHKILFTALLPLSPQTPASCVAFARAVEDLNRKKEHPSPWPHYWYTARQMCTSHVDPWACDQTPQPLSLSGWSHVVTGGNGGLWETWTVRYSKESRRAVPSTVSSISVVGSVRHSSNKRRLRDKNPWE